MANWSICWWSSVGCASPYHELGHTPNWSMHWWSSVVWHICDSVPSHPSVPLTDIHLVLQSAKGPKTAWYSPFKCKKSHARISLKAKNATKIKKRIVQNVTAMGRPKLHWVEVSRCDKSPIFRPILGWMNNSSTLGLNVAVVKRYRDEKTQS